MSTTSTIKKERKSKPSPKIPKKHKKQMEEQKEVSNVSLETEKKERKNKKISKFISKQSCVIENTEPVTESYQEKENPKKNNLPNVVVCFRCQLSDLEQNEDFEETIIENKPFEYKAWVSSDIKTYNTDYQIGNLSMEPLNNIQKDNNIEHYAYLDTKWLNLISNQGNENNPNKMISMGFMNENNKEISEKRYDTFETKHTYDKNQYQTNFKSAATTITSNHTENNSFIESNKNEKERNERVLFKETQEKIYHQKVLLYHGMVKNDKKSACFWCTCDYDTPSCAIPYYNVQGNLDGYGSFCRPECAVAFLYSEKLDDSIRADRDHLINYYYGKSFGYEKRIKPAPDPHYLLDKFYGNLTIQEYRKLLKSEHLLATLDKPLTRVFPELHEITDDFLIKIYGGDITLNRGYRVKRASEQNKAPSKMEILRDQFRPPAVKA